MRRQDSAPGPAPASPQPYYSPHLGLVGEGKGKKWWGEKLRLSRPPQRHESHSAYLLNEYRHKYGTLSSGSALSRSMKYAETWLYGSVRTPPPTFLVNICSCPEQLAPGGGTRRGLRAPHAGICKKCGGSRAVYAPAGGTVRATRSRPALFIPTQPPPPPLSAPPPPLKAATPDPYDLMRRNRLGTMGDPMANPNAVHRGRTRAKSSSPTRRMQPHRSPSPSVVRPTQFNVNKLVGMEASADKRKSILECDVNAYELIAKYLKGDRKAFASADDDALSDDLSDNALENGNTTKTEQNYNNRQSVGGGVTIGGQRIRISASQSLCDVNDFVTDEDEEEEVPPPRFASLSFRRSSPPPSPASGIPRPRRPPRKQKSAVTTPLTPSESEDDSELLAAAACLLESPAIKSILKKPADAFCDTVSKPDLPVRSPSPADFYLPTFQEFRQQRKKKQVQFVCFTPDEDHTVPEATLVGGDEEEEEDDDRDEESEKDDDVGSSDDATPIGVQLGHDARRQSEESFSQELALVAATANLPPRPPGAATLRRSLSDRLAIQPPPVAAAFNDTMRLRQRPRSDSRLVFEHVSHQSLSAELPPRRPQRVLSPGRPRPREPPPPPPPLPPAAPQRVRAPPLGMLRNQQQARRPPSISLSTDDISLPVELNSQPSPQQNPKGLQVPKLGRPNSWASSVEGRDIFRKKEHRNSDPGPGPGGLKPGQTLLQSSTEYDEASGDSVVPSMEQDQLDRLEADARTIVTVTSPPSPSVHRLQVRSESVSNLGAESPLSSRRTSIFITSGTHHSEGLRRAASEFDLARNGASRTSVSIRGQSPVVESTKRDINKVTISVGGVAPNAEHYQRSSSRTVIDTSNPNIIYNKNNTSSLTILSPSDTLSNHIVIPVTPEPSSVIFLGAHSSVELTNRATNNSPFLWQSETEVTPESDEKCLPNKITILDSDTGDNSSISNVIIETTAETTGNEESEEEADEEDPSELDEETRAALLKDPVEAVRRNLVPHVCGKTDPISAVDRLSTLLSKQEETPQEDPYLLDGAKAHSEADDTAKSLLLDTADLEIAANDDIDDEIENVYESIKDHIYEEIGDVASTHSPQVPPQIVEETCEDGQTTSRSIFEGASKYDILNYLADARERVPEEESVSPAGQEQPNIELSSRASQLSNASDSSEDSISAETPSKARKSSAEIERNDSGVGSETSKSSRSRWQQAAGDDLLPCEDCDQRVDTHVSESGVVYAPLVCRKCAKRRAERKELLAEIVDTEEKYARDLKITLDEFYRPMLVAGLLTPDQLASIFLNTQELLEHSRALAHKLRDSLDMALEQGDEDFLTVNMGRLFLEAAPMLHAFESYCTRQGAASMLLANLEKERELLRIFLRVNQMDNAVLRRMNLNSFLMVPVQRVTKYPLLLARLYKVTPAHHEGRELLKQAQHKIELHLEHINSEAKDISTMKLWRRISIINGRRSSSESDMINIKLRKMALEILEWNRDEISFSMEGKLLYTNPTDNNWRKGRTIKLNPINALLVTKGKTQEDYQPEPTDDLLMFPRKNGVREATLLLVREKSGRYSLLRDPLFLDKCIVCCETDWEDYFEVQELASKETFIFKGEDGERTKIWYRTLQYHAQGLGAWRRRRNALANIINDMVPRN